jgi:hypothetical protein
VSRPTTFSDWHLKESWFSLRQEGYRSFRVTYQLLKEYLLFGCFQHLLTFGCRDVIRFGVFCFFFRQLVCPTNRFITPTITMSYEFVCCLLWSTSSPSSAVLPEHYDS